MKLKIVTIAALGLLASACSDAPTAERILRQNGFTNIQTTGYSWFACDGKSDSFATGFEATSPAGVRVRGAVCSGMFKGGTIRFF